MQDKIKKARGARKLEHRIGAPPHFNFQYVEDVKAELRNKNDKFDNQLPEIQALVETRKPGTRVNTAPQK